VKDNGRADDIVPRADIVGKSIVTGGVFSEKEKFFLL